MVMNDMDVYGTLMQELQKRIAPIVAREEEINARLFELQNLLTDKELHAQCGVLARNIEEATARAEHEKAEILREEMAEVEGRIVARREEAGSLAGERADLKAKRKKTADSVLKDVYPMIRKNCSLDPAETLAASLEGAWEDIRKFSRETGAYLSESLHKNGLRIRSIGETARLQIRLSDWV